MKWLDAEYIKRRPGRAFCWHVGLFAAWLVMLLFMVMCAAGVKSLRLRDVCGLQPPNIRVTDPPNAIESDKCSRLTQLQ